MSLPNGISAAGTLVPSQQPISIHISRTSGSTYRVSYRGLAAQIAAKFNALFRGAFEAEYDQPPGSPVATCTFTYQSPQDGSVEQSNDTMDLDFKGETGSIFLATDFATITPARKAALERLLERYKVPDAKAADLEVDRLAEIENDAEDAAFNLMLRSVEVYEWEVPIITLNRTVSAAFPTGIVPTNNGLIWTTAQVSDYLGTPILFSIPAVVNNVGVPAGWSAGWKYKGRVTWMANGNAQLSETFEYGAWATRSASQKGLYDMKA